MYKDRIIIFLCKNKNTENVYKMLVWLEQITVLHKQKSYISIENFKILAILKIYYSTDFCTHWAILFCYFILKKAEK